MYSKQEAIDAIKRGDKFKDKKFNQVRDDKDVVLEAFKQEVMNLRLASDEIKADKAFILELVRHDSMAFVFANEDLQKDREITLAAVRKGGWALRHTSLELKADRKLVLEAVKHYEPAIEYASEGIRELCKNKDPVLTLEAVLRMENFQADLKPKAASQTRSLKI